MTTAACSISIASHLLMSTVLVIMTMHDVTHSVILRPKWFPYFRNSEGAQNAGNHSGRPEQGWSDLEGLSEEERRRHLQLQSQLGQHSEQDLQRAVQNVRESNCTTTFNTTVPDCYYRYTSLLLRILQRNFYDAVSPTRQQQGEK